MGSDDSNIPFTDKNDAKHNKTSEEKMIFENQDLLKPTESHLLKKNDGHCEESIFGHESQPYPSESSEITYVEKSFQDLDSDLESEPIHLKKQKNSQEAKTKTIDRNYL